MYYIIKNWKTFTENKSTAEEFLKKAIETEGIKLCEHIIGALKYAMDKDLDETVIMRLDNSIEPDKLITATKQDYRLVLSVLLSYCESRELYELCADIFKLTQIIEKWEN